MTLQPNSAAGKIRSALEKLGWDADPEDIITEVGPVYRSVLNRNDGQWEEEWGYFHVHRDYVHQVRRMAFRANAKRTKGETLPPEFYDWM